MNEEAAKRAWLARAEASAPGNWGPNARRQAPTRGAGRLAVRSAAPLAARVTPTGAWSASSEPHLPEDQFASKDRTNYDIYLAQNGLLNKPDAQFATRG